jgi:putative phage-type endonuclease
MTETLIQGSDDWLAARVGCITASRMADLMARTKSGWGASRANLAAELLVERLTGQPAPRFLNDAMRWGTEQEPFARQAYSERCGVDVFEVGFIPHPEIARAGASPDGYVGDDGLVEFKCPTSATHIDTLMGGRVPERYLLQMQFQMACAGREWCDFVSFDPRCPEHLRLFIQRVPRDHSLILSLEGEVVALDTEIEAKIEALSRQYARAA